MATTRRTFIAATSTTLCLGPLLGCSAQPSGLIPAGTTADLTVGDLIAIEGEKVALGLDAGGLYAMTTLCTHARCDISKNGTIDGAGLVCGCHGSVFDVGGGVVDGPANKPLRHFAVELDADGTITIDADTEVDADERTPVEMQDTGA